MGEQWCSQSIRSFDRQLGESGLGLLQSLLNEGIWKAAVHLESLISAPAEGWGAPLVFWDASTIMHVLCLYLLRPEESPVVPEIPFFK